MPCCPVRSALGAVDGFPIVVTWNYSQYPCPEAYLLSPFLETWKLQPGTIRLELFTIGSEERLNIKRSGLWSSLPACAGGSANLYSNFGKQYGIFFFSEKWESIYLKMQLYHSQRMFIPQGNLLNYLQRMSWISIQVNSFYMQITPTLLVATVFWGINVTALEFRQ